MHVYVYFTSVCNVCVADGFRPSLMKCIHIENETDEPRYVR